MAAPGIHPVNLRGSAENALWRADAGRNLSEECAEISEELRSFLKSSEEVDRLTLPENLSTVDRALLLLSGDAIQQNCGFAHLPFLLAENVNDTFEKVWPRMLKAAKQKPATLAAFCVVLESVVARRLLPPDGRWIEEYVLPAVQEFIEYSKDEEVIKNWGDILLLLIEQAPTVASRVLPFVSRLCDITASLPHRLLGCSCLGSMARRIGFDTSLLLDRSIALCEDTEYQVREAICRQLRAIVHAVGSENSKGMLLDELLELIKDEEAVVKSAAFECFAALLDFFDADTRTARMIPVLRELAGGMPDAVMRAVAKTFGEFMVKAANELEPATCDQLYGLFKQIAAKRDAELRRLCAANMPGMLRSMGPKTFAVQFYELFQQLSADENTTVRRAVACVLAEVTSMLSKEFVSEYLKETFVRLLRDPCYAVREPILNSLEKLLSRFSPIANGSAPRGREEPATASRYAEFIPILVGCHHELTAAGWRLQLAFVEQARCWPTFFTTDELCHHFIPLLWERTSTRYVLPVKLAAVKALCHLSRRLPTSQRQAVVNRFVDGLGRGRSCHDRLLFIEACKELAEVYSHRFFKSWFFSPVLELSRDPVPNVRWKLCELLPRLRSMLQLPNDSALFKKFTNAFIALKGNDDREVAERSVQLSMTVFAPVDQLQKSSVESEEWLQEQRKQKEEDEMQLREQEELGQKRRFFNGEDVSKSKATIERTEITSGKKPVASASASSNHPEKVLRKKPSTKQQPAKPKAVTPPERLSAHKSPKDRQSASQRAVPIRTKMKPKK